MVTRETVFEHTILLSKATPKVVKKYKIAINFETISFSVLNGMKSVIGIIPIEKALIKVG